MSGNHHLSSAAVRLPSLHRLPRDGDRATVSGKPGGHRAWRQAAAPTSCRALSKSK